MSKLIPLLTCLLLACSPGTKPDSTVPADTGVTDSKTAPADAKIVAMQKDAAPRPLYESPARNGKQRGLARLADSKSYPLGPPAVQADVASPPSMAAFDKMSQDALDDRAKAKGADKPSPIERIDDNRLRVGRVEVDRKERTVKVPAGVNQREGILEYLAVGPRGKAHESVLVLRALPSHIHLALLLVGATPSSDNGTPLRLTVEWTDKKTGKLRRKGVENWLFDRRKQKTAGRLKWAFLGSRFWNGLYQADQSSSVIGLIRDPDVVIVLADNMGNPYRGSDQGFEPNKDRLPAIGTKATLIIKPE